MQIDFQRLMRAGNGDAEFRLMSRFLDTRLELQIGKDRHQIDIHDGEILAIRPADDETHLAHPSTILIKAPEDDWQRYLEAVPRPFYQDLWAAQTHHGFEVIGDRATFHAYYRATARLLEVLRAIVNDDREEAA